MCKIRINKEKCVKLFEVYNTPDHINMNDDIKTWYDEDAIPFFVLSSMEVVVCPKQTKHLDYYSKGKTPYQERDFVNKVILQGRYWESTNTMSFWLLKSQDLPYIRAAYQKICDKTRDCFILYRDKKYKINHDENYIWLSTTDISDGNRKNTLDVREFNKLKDTFDETKDYVARNYGLRVEKNGVETTRKFNDYELFAATCFQFWTDYLRTSNVICTTEEFKTFISLLTNKTHTLDEMLDYFYSKIRRKRGVLSQDINSIKYQPMNNDNLIGKTLNRLGVDDSEYEIEYYQGTNLPYSFTIKIYDNIDRFKEIVGNFKAHGDKFIVDRVFGKKLYNNKVLTSCRVRLTPENDAFWNKK